MACLVGNTRRTRRVGRGECGRGMRGMPERDDGVGVSEEWSDMDAEKNVVCFTIVLRKGKGGMQVNWLWMSGKI